MSELWTGVAQLNCQKKGGKTTLAMNAAHALLTSEPFLGRYPVNTTVDDRVAYLNMELMQEQFLERLVQMQVSEEHLKRLEPYHARDCGALNFRNDLAVEWLIKWLCDNGITLLVIDPLSSVYDPTAWGTSDPNAAYLRFWTVLEDVVRQANLRGVLILHHTGFSEDAANRARGASAMMDKPDVNLTYRYNIADGGNYSDKPTDSKRYLSAFGRGVDVDEFELDYCAPTRHLFATGTGSRSDAAKARLANDFWSAVNRLCADGGDEPSKAKVYGALGWPDSGTGSKRYDAARQYAIREGWVTVRPGNGKTKLHSPGPSRPKGYGDHVTINAETDANGATDEP